MARRKGRRSFGSMRQLPSGRWQARYRDAAGKSHTAPETFATRPEAARFLAQVLGERLERDRWQGHPQMAPRCAGSTGIPPAPGVPGPPMNPLTPPNPITPRPDGRNLRPREMFSLRRHQGT